MSESTQLTAAVTKTAATTENSREARPARRNPGPSWGFQFLRGCDQIVPEWFFRPWLAAGSWVAMAVMPAQRRNSREYLTAVLLRKPTATDLFRHFFAFAESLMLKLRVANGKVHGGVLAEGAEDFGEWLKGGKPALLGTFHLGTSDLLGFLIAGIERRRIYLVRQRVGNSHDTEKLASRFGELIQFVWVNRAEEMLFALKDAAARGDGAIALQCDRLEFSSRVETFEFLGARRKFPFTIYHLSMIFEMPVLLSVGLPTADLAQSRLYGLPAFLPVQGESRAAMLLRAREHFQSFLRLVEMRLREQPYQWFNFLPLNPRVEASGEAVS